MNPLIQFKNPILFFVVSLVFACLAFSSAQAVNPPPDGGYDRGNAAEGDDALFSLTATGASNTSRYSLAQALILGSLLLVLSQGLYNRVTADIGSRL